MSDDILKTIDENSSRYKDEEVAELISILHKDLSNLSDLDSFGDGRARSISLDMAGKLASIASRIKVEEDEEGFGIDFSNYFNEDPQASDEVKPPGSEIVLNEGQDAALEKVIDFFKRPKGQGDNFFGLYGFAGTGKSTVAQTIYRELKRDFGGKVGVAMSAPTHKAVGVLSDLYKNSEIVAGASPHFSTIHSLLAIKRVVKGREEHFKPDPHAEQAIYQFPYVFVDECSMISEELYQYIEEAGDSWSGPKILFMGDPLQLPPVGYDSSPTFDTPNSHTLDEVVRFGGVINKAVTDMRNSIGTDTVASIEPGSDSTGVVEKFNHYGPWTNKLLGYIQEGRDAKALAFTNRRVDKINKYIRDKIYGKGAAPYLNGERLVAVNTVTDDYENIFLHTGDECEVIEAKESIKFELDCWELKVKNLVTRDVETIYTTDERQMVLLKNKLSELARKKDWGMFWPMKEAFANLRPPFCTTVHKSQGSTYDHVFIDIRNVMACGNDSDFKSKLLYVAFSRAAKGLHIS